MQKIKHLLYIFAFIVISGCVPSTVSTSEIESVEVVQVEPSPTDIAPTSTYTLEPTYTPEPLPTDTPEPTPLPGDLVYPIDTLSNSIPWLPLDEDKRPTACYFGFNLEMPPFNNILVRQAFAAAVDRQVIAELADRFYTEKFPNVTLVVSTRGEAAPGAYSRMADAIVEMWQEHLGISIEVDVIGDDGYYFLDLLPNNLPHMYQLTWGADVNDPDNFLRELFHSTSELNFGHFSNDQFDDLVEQASRSNDPAERQELYIQAERILTEDLAGIIPLYHSYFYPGE